MLLFKKKVSIIMSYTAIFSKISIFWVTCPIWISISGGGRLHYDDQYLLANNSPKPVPNFHYVGEHINFHLVVECIIHHFSHRSYFSSLLVRYDSCLLRTSFSGYMLVWSVLDCFLWYICRYMLTQLFDYSGYTVVPKKKVSELASATRRVQQLSYW